MIDAVQKLAEARWREHGAERLVWVLRNPLVSAPIVGATKPNHLAEAVDAISLELTDEEVHELEAPYRNPGHRGISSADLRLGERSYAEMGAHLRGRVVQSVRTSIELDSRVTP